MGSMLLLSLIVRVVVKTREVLLVVDHCIRVQHVS